jgi:hypothetical protein
MKTTFIDIEFIRKQLPALIFMVVFAGVLPLSGKTALQDTISQDTTLLNQFFTIFEQDEGDNIPEAQRSKRKQVDALLKAMMEQPGQLRFSGVTTASVQTALNHKTPYYGVGSFDIFAYSSFGRHALLFFDLEAIGGNGPDAQIPNVSVLNADAGRTTSADGIDRITILEAWTEFKALKDIFTVTVGKIDLTNYYDNNLHANDETSQFLSGVFVNNPVLPVYFNSPGINFRTAFLGRFYIQYGRAMADANEIDITKNHIQALETGFQLFPESGWKANFRVLGFEHPFARESYGMALSYDQLFANTFTIFGRFGKNENKLAEFHQIKEAWSGGVGFRQQLFKREFNVGMGYAETYTFETEIPERAGEAYMSHQLNQWVFFSLHLQWLKRHEAEPKEHFFGGVRLNFTY